MPDTKYVNKVIYAGETLIDLTKDTVLASDVLAAGGHTFHLKDGSTVTGTCTFNIDASSATAAASEIIAGKTAAVGDSLITGTMPTIDVGDQTLKTVEDVYHFPNPGYVDGSGSFAIDSTEKAKIIPTNIRQGISILGVIGTMSGTEDVHIQDPVTVTPTKGGLTVEPEEGYNGLSKVIVNPIAYTSENNAAGGTTVTIGTP